MISSRIARQQSLYASQANTAIPALRRDLAALQEQLITGRRVNRPSDDPSAFAQARLMESLDEQYTQHLRTIDSSRLWVNQTSDALDTLTERFADAYDEGLKALNDTLNQGDRNAVAGRVEALMEEVIDTLNAKSGGEYLFAGTRTTTEPFDEDGTPTGNLSGERNRQIGPNTTLAINISGEHVLDAGDGVSIVESLQTMIDALRGERTVPLEDAVGDVGVARDHLIDLGAELGATARRLGHAELQLQNASIETQRRRSELEDADYFATISAFQQTQTTLEAALSTTASLVQTTLLDYLR